MSTQNTPGRLQAGVSLYKGAAHFTAVSENNTQKIIALCGRTGAADEPESIANTRRLAACWNACEGVSTENLEDNIPVKDLAQRFNLALAQRDALLEALQGLMPTLNRVMHLSGETWDLDDEESVQAAKAAIAKATGGGA